MTDTIEIEVTESVAEMYDELVEQHGKPSIQSGLTQTVIPFVRGNYEELQESDR